MSPDLVTVRVEKALEPTQTTLQQAIALAWETLRSLPLGENQLQSLAYRFGSDAEHWCRQEFDARGRSEVLFLLDGDLRAVEITPAVPAAR